MVYIKDWPEFQQRSIKLYQQNPRKTRYLIKSRPSQQSLTLKVTDDVTTIKYRTRSSAILGRLEVFNKAMTFAMAGSRSPLKDAEPAQPTTEAAAAAATTTTQTANGGAAGAGSASTTAAAGGAAAGAAGQIKRRRRKRERSDPSHVKILNPQPSIHYDVQTSGCRFLSISAGGLLHQP